MNIILAIGVVGLIFAVAESGMRYLDWPPTVISGWRATVPGGPVNQLGLRGVPWHGAPGDFVVVVTGAEEVECTRCPASETFDRMLTEALRRFVPNARAVTLGATGYGPDQELLLLQDYFRRDRADLVVLWTGLARDMPRAMFRSGHPSPDRTTPKPSFAMIKGALRGPTEPSGTRVHRSKIATLIQRTFLDFDARWTSAMPPADPGLPVPPEGIPRVLGGPSLETQNTDWLAYLTPQPPRAVYGVSLMRALLSHMRGLAALHGAKFAVLADRHDPDGLAPDVSAAAPGHDGHWYRADRAQKEAAMDAIGKDLTVVPFEPGAIGSADDAQRAAVRMAETLSRLGLLTRPPAGARK